MTNEKTAKKWAEHNEKMKNETTKSKTTNRKPLPADVKSGTAI